ncbi:hypothetical protein AVEN_150836-1 [Araneus ventricosus]|uniref:Uncharacterized protein n=1 Tax=Araneus ventricosus TaxID=182803 RepID=A0A4Y2JA40_ARAVE|nr:hypothetical protein AVEN_150836-1 [Araneus ventricosus]
MEQKQINYIKKRGKLLSKEVAKRLCANAAKKKRIRHKKNLLKIKNKTDLPRHSRECSPDNYASKEILMKTVQKLLPLLKLAGDANTSLIEEKSVKDKEPSKTRGEAC